MTNHTSYTWLRGAPVSSADKQQLACRIGEVVVTLLLIAALTGAWLAFFTFVPLDFTLPRVR